MSKITDVAKEHLDTNDAVLHRYRGIYNRIEGFLLVSKQKLLFVQEKGVFSKRYENLLELPYTTVENIDVAASHRLVITEGNTTYPIVTLDTQADLIEDVLQQLIEAIQPVTKTVQTRSKKTKK